MSEAIAENEIRWGLSRADKRSLRPLRALMFLHFFGMGALAPLLNVYLQESLGFTGGQAATIMALMPLGMILGSIVNSSLADRIVSTERLYISLKIVSAMMALTLCFAQSFAAVFVAFGIYALCFAPSGSLKEAICFQRVPYKLRNDYGSVRVFATFGWILAGISVPLLHTLLSAAGLPLTLFHTVFICMVLSALANAGITLALPRREAPKSGELKPTLIPLAAIKVLRHPAILLLTVGLFCAGFCDRYFFFAMGPYLRSLGVESSVILPLLSTGQVLEIGCLFTLGFWLRRFGFRKIMLIGASMHLLRFCMLTFGSSVTTAVIGTIAHGVAFGFFFVPATMCFERLCPREHFASAYLLFSIITIGGSGLAANLIGGQLFDFQSGYGLIWSAPLLAAFLLFCLTLVQLLPKFPRRASYGLNADEVGRGD